MLGQYLDNLTWPEAEAALRETEVVLIPVGARTKEHGRHLPLNTDWREAEYLTKRLLERFSAVAVPTVQYGYYPAFVEYPGSVSLGKDTFRDVISDICRSLSRFGVKRFYVINTGISTIPPLKSAQDNLRGEQIPMAFTDLSQLLVDLEASVKQQSEGTHADEIETSMMLYIAPEVVKMQLAQKDIHERKGNGPLTRDPNYTQGLYSPTGAWGDPTLATVEKGRVVIEGMVERIAAEISAFISDSSSTS